MTTTNPLPPANTFAYQFALIHERLNAIEARQAFNQQHDPSCSNAAYWCVREINKFNAAIAPRCDCWLSR